MDYPSAVDDNLDIILDTKMIDISGVNFTSQSKVFADKLVEQLQRKIKNYYN